MTTWQRELSQICTILSQILFLYYKLTATRPGPEASILLSAYDFATANPLFINILLTLPPSSKGQEPPLSSFRHPLTPWTIIV